MPDEKDASELYQESINQIKGCLDDIFGDMTEAAIASESNRLLTEDNIKLRAILDTLKMILNNAGTGLGNEDDIKKVAEDIAKNMSLLLAIARKKEGYAPFLRFLNNFQGKDNQAHEDFLRALVGMSPKYQAKDGNTDKANIINCFASILLFIDNGGYDKVVARFGLQHLMVNDRMVGDPKQLENLKTPAELLEQLIPIHGDTKAREIVAQTEAIIVTQKEIIKRLDSIFRGVEIEPSDDLIKYIKEVSKLIDDNLDNLLRFAQMISRFNTERGAPLIRFLNRFRGARNEYTNEDSLREFLRMPPRSKVEIMLGHFNQIRKVICTDEDSLEDFSKQLNSINPDSDLQDNQVHIGKSLEIIARLCVILDGSRTKEEIESTIASVVNDIDPVSMKNLMSLATTMTDRRVPGSDEVLNFLNDFVGKDKKSLENLLKGFIGGIPARTEGKTFLPGVKRFISGALTPRDASGKKDEERKKNSRLP